MTISCFIKGVLRADSIILVAAETGTLIDKRRPSRTEHRPRSRGCFYSVALVFAALITLFPRPLDAITLSHADVLKIGKKIWQNECNGTIAGLTSWNAGEDFASLGIGHFIWYPKGMRGPFEESFPKFLEFAHERNVTVPVWVNQATFCPWNSRAAFSRAENSAQMRELRQFLSHTVDLQAEFLVARLQQSLAKMLDGAAPNNRANVERQFARVASTPQGCYALVDYVNFKGEGVLQTERYSGEGWGLLQALQAMHGTGNDAAATGEFSNSTAAILRRRVQNSPPERHEARWLPGWLNRVRTYSENS